MIQDKEFLREFDECVHELIALGIIQTSYDPLTGSTLIKLSGEYGDLTLEEAIKRADQKILAKFAKPQRF